MQPVRDRPLASDSIPTLSNALSRMLRVSTVTLGFSTTVTSAMFSRRRACGISHGRGFGSGRRRVFYASKGSHH